MFVMFVRSTTLIACKRFERPEILPGKSRVLAMVTSTVLGSSDVSWKPYVLHLSAIALKSGS